MSMKLQQIVSSMAVLKELAENKNINSDLAFDIAEIMIQLYPHLKAYQKTENDLILKYGAKNKAGVPEIKDTNKNWLVFLEERGKVLAKDIKIKITPLKKEQFKGLKIAPKTFFVLNWLIKK